MLLFSPTMMQFKEGRFLLAYGLRDGAWKQVSEAVGQITQLGSREACMLAPSLLSLFFLLNTRKVRVERVDKYIDR